MWNKKINTVYGLLLALSVATMSTAALGQAQLTYSLVDGPNSIDWRGGYTDVGSATETYSYFEAIDTLTVTVTFDKTSSVAPVAPMLAIAEEYGFDVQFDDPIVYSGYHSQLGPMKGVENVSQYTYHITGLKKYVLDTQTIGGGQSPSWLENELEAQVDKILAAGHLSPWLVMAEVPGGPDTRGQVYWHYPGEILYFLAEVAPLLSEAKQDQLKTYLQNERQTYPPETQVSVPFSAGTRREYCGPSGTLLNNWQNDILAFRTTGVPRIWNMYGLSKYYEFAEETPASSVMQDCNSVITQQMEHRHWPTLYWFKGYAPHYNAVHGVNQIFAGLIGYIRLARMVGDTDAEDLGWGLLGRMAALRFAMGKYTQYEYDYGYFTIGDPLDPAWYAEQEAGTWVGDLVTWDWTQPIDNVRQVHWLNETIVMGWEWCSVGQYHHDDGLKTMPPPPAQPANRPNWAQGTAYLLPFCDMVPEMGRFLADYLKPEVQEYCDRVVENQPHWYAAYAEAILGQEIGFNVPGDSYGQFMARTWVLDDEPNVLEHYVDVPWVEKGDLFYAHKLSETIKAYRGTRWVGGGPAFFAVVGTSYNDDPTIAVEEAYTEAYDKLGDFRTPRIVLVTENYGDSATKALVVSEANSVPVYGMSTGAGNYSVQSYEDGFVRTPKGIAVTLVGGTFDMQVETIQMGSVNYSDPCTMVQNRQIPGAELGARFTYSLDPNTGEFLYVVGCLHNPEIQYFATGLDESTPNDVPIIGGAHNVAGSSGAVYNGSGTASQSALVIRFTGDFDVTQSMDGPYWQAENNPEVPPQMITNVVDDLIADINEPDLTISFICASLRPWTTDPPAQQYMNDQHQALVNALPSACEYLGVYSGGEMGKFDDSNDLSSGGAYVSMLAVKSRSGTLNRAPSVYAGLDKNIESPPGTILLDATISDDGLPSGTVTVTWSKVSGAGNVVFYDKFAVDTTATFDTLGEYVLRLTADDGERQDYDEVTITVLPPDIYPPTPDPPVWASVPQATGPFTISMAVADACDLNGVEYYFECVVGDGNDSGWQDVTIYEATGLDANTLYSYRVKARDKSNSQNETGWSATESATTEPIDTTPPSPDPLTWAVLPYADGTNALTMSATTATDAKPVEYFFECTAGGGHDSGWQDSQVYTDVGLIPETQYTYRVKTRDKSLYQNETGWSPQESGTTSQVTPLLQDSGPEGIVSVEAENYSLNTAAGGKTWTFVQQPAGFAGAGAMQALPNTGSNVTYGAGSPRLDFEVNFVKTGIHYVWLRGYGATDFDDSCHSGLDGASSTTSDQVDVPTATLAWTNLSMRGNDVTIDIPSTGLHTFNIWMREDGFIVDKIVLTTSEAYAPSGDGPAESARSGGVSDTTPPTPDPAEWATEPHPTGDTSISMTAVTASDASGVEYYFECTAGGGNSSSWQDSITYEDTGLTASTQYTYRVKARDKSSNHNETGWSAERSATTDAPDSAPPTPDPTTWATLPHATGTTSISMAASTVSDPSGVEYYFECTTAGGHSSTWQDSSTYEDTGLDPNTQYTYRAKARDKSANQNETGWSTSESATTQADGGENITEGLLAYWKFDEGSGTSVADSSGNGNVGTLSGSPQWIAGQVDDAISLDGIDDYMAGFNVDLGGEWSIAVWAKPLAQPEFQGLLGSPAGSGGNYIQLQSNRLHYKGNANNYTSFTQDLEWHHFAITRAASGDIVVYIDGTQADSYTDVDASFVITQVGRFWDNSNYTYQGSVDELRLYDRVLSIDEVDACMNYSGDDKLGDINGDGQVDYKDMDLLGQLWLWSGEPGAVPEDIKEDGHVDLYDFAELANQWLE